MISVDIPFSYRSTLGSLLKATLHVDVEPLDEIVTKHHLFVCCHQVTRRLKDGLAMFPDDAWAKERFRFLSNDGTMRVLSLEVRHGI